MSNLNKSELVAAVAAHTGESQAAVNRVVDALFETIAKTVAKGGKVTIPGWLSALLVRAATHRLVQPSRSQQLTPLRFQLVQS